MASAILPAIRSAARFATDPNMRIARGSDCQFVYLAGKIGTVQVTRSKGSGLASRQDGLCSANPLVEVDDLASVVPGDPLDVFTGRCSDQSATKRDGPAKGLGESYEEDGPSSNAGRHV
jgi:hypothetical protein